MDLKTHLAPFVVFGGLGLYALWYVFQSIIAWRRDGSLGVRNRLRWMPFGPGVSMISDWVRGGDPTDDRPVHQLRNPILIVSWLFVCVAVAGVMLDGAVNFLRFGHSF